MKELKEFTIPFIGLKIGEHRFEFTIEKPFFEHFEYNEFNDAAIKLDVLLVKKATLLEFTLTFKGIVNVNCDVSNEPYNQKVDDEYRFVVKFGEDHNEEDEDLLVLPHGSYEVNIQQFIYESIVLSMPIKKIHPGVEDGTLKSDILDKLEELRLKEKNENPDEKEIDPRWNEFKKLLTDK